MDIVFDNAYKFAEENKLLLCCNVISFITESLGMETKSSAAASTGSKSIGFDCLMRVVA